LKKNDGGALRLSRETVIILSTQLNHLRGGGPTGGVTTTIPTHPACITQSEMVTACTCVAQ
jgi:hypothetical protein